MSKTQEPQFAREFQTRARAVAYNVCLIYLLWQSERTAAIWSILAEARAYPDGDPRRVESYARASAYACLLVLYLDAWPQLCAAYNVDPVGVLRGLPGVDMLEGVEEFARDLAWTVEELPAWIDTLPPGKTWVHARTVDEALADLRKMASERWEAWQPAPNWTPASSA